MRAIHMQLKMGVVYSAGCVVGRISTGASLTSASIIYGSNSLVCNFELLAACGIG
jgi:hypothetical protein